MDNETFMTIVSDNRKLIYKICRTYCNDTANRRDLEQEILTQLWLTCKKFDGRVKVTTWMYRIALNTAISFYRNDCKTKLKHTVLDSVILSLPIDDTDVILNENIKLLYTFIESLNELDKALMLLYLDDNKYRDIAEILGISETNVATKIGRIKKVLKVKFENI